MKIRLAVTSLTILTVITVSFSCLLYYQSAREHARQILQNKAKVTLEIVFRQIERALHEDKEALDRLASLPEVREFLDALNDDMLKIEIDEVIDRYNVSNNSQATHVLDRSGTVVATSNRNRFDSFLQKNHSSEPYFKQGMEGHFFAEVAVVGAANNEEGIYIGVPVYRQKEEAPIGVVVNKKTLSSISRVIDNVSSHEKIMLVGPFGYVLHTNNPRYMHKFLWKLSSMDESRLRESMTYGDGLKPWVGLTKTSTPHVIRDTEGRDIFIHEKELPMLGGWQLMVINDQYDSAGQLALFQTGRVGTFILPIIGLFCLFTGIIHLTAIRDIKKQGQREAELEIRYDHLKSEVAQRTFSQDVLLNSLRKEIKQHKVTSTNLEENLKSQELVTKVLKLYMESGTLDEMLENFIMLVTSFPGYGLLPKGAIFLVGSNHDTLELRAQRDLNSNLLKICRQVPFGRCLCGRAAEKGEIVFASHVDSRHDNQYQGIRPHGHYCIPLFLKNRELLGVFTVYTEEQTPREARVVKFLQTMASSLAIIVAQRLTDKELQDINEKNRAITDFSSDGIIMMDENDLITYWNPMAAKIFGYTDKEAIGKGLDELMTPEHSHKVAGKQFRTFAKGGCDTSLGKTFEVEALTKDGRNIAIELSFSGAKVKGGWSTICFVRDISEKKKDAAEFLQLRQQLRQTQKMEALGTLAGGISHDFNNILTSILGFAELAREEVADRGDVAEDLNMVITSALRAKNLVKQIRTFSRQQETELEPLKISTMIKESIKMLRASIPANIKIEEKILVEDSLVIANPSQINQMIMNLCVNAFQAMKTKGGVLEVRLDKAKVDADFHLRHPLLANSDYLCFSVTDTGDGMDSYTLSRVYEPYFSTREKEDGTGLGLAVVHGIVKLLQGDIIAESVIGEGSSFKVLLPIHNEKAPVYNLIDGMQTTWGGNEQVLLVDDEPSVEKFLKRKLEKYGYTVTSLSSSRKTLEMFVKSPRKFDVIVTDNYMPDLMGLELAREVKEIRQDIPIILCTGYDEISTSKMIKEKIINKILLKPISGHDLPAAVRTVLDNREHRGNQNLI